ncbi:MAG: DNA-binding protein [Oleiphilus sp.]|nr:MAG: DNA-binding protein [Oleiphilus sp.]
MSATLLSLTEVSKLLDKPEVTIKRYARENLLPSVKEGSDLKFPEDAVKRYLEIEKKLN